MLWPTPMHKIKAVGGSVVIQTPARPARGLMACTLSQKRSNARMCSHAEHGEQCCWHELEYQKLEQHYWEKLSTEDVWKRFLTPLNASKYLLKIAILVDFIRTKTVWSWCILTHSVTRPVTPVKQQPPPPRPRPLPRMPPRPRPLPCTPPCSHGFALPRTRPPLCPLSS